MVFDVTIHGSFMDGFSGTIKLKHSEGLEVVNNIEAPVTWISDTEFSMVVASDSRPVITASYPDYYDYVSTRLNDYTSSDEVWSRQMNYKQIIYGLILDARTNSLIPDVGITVTPGNYRVYIAPVSGLYFVVLPAGTYTVAFDKTGYLPATKNIEVAALSRNNLHVELVNKRGAVSGGITCGYDTRGVAVGATVKLMQGKNLVAVTSSVTGGVYTFQDVEVGDYYVTASITRNENTELSMHYRGRSVGSISVTGNTVTEGVNVALVSRQPGIIKGYMAHGNYSRVLRNMPYTFQDDSGYSGRGRTNDLGAYAHRLPAGDYELTFNSSYGTSQAIISPIREGEFLTRDVLFFRQPPL